jgi:hypothetical protein
VPARIVTWVVFAGFGAVAGRFAPLTAPAEITVLLAGAAMILWATGVRPPIIRVAPPRRKAAPDTVNGRGALLWLALLLAFTGWELYALFASPAAAHPTVSALAGPLLAPHWHRAVAYVLWLAGGVWLARR